MATKHFTDASIRALKVARKSGERYERFEPGGLGVRVGNRNKSFIYLYRHRGKARRMTLGRYPEMSLADARVALAVAQLKVKQGVDPGAQVVEQRQAEREAETVTELSRLYISLHALPKKKSWRKDQRVLSKDVLPVIGHIKAKDVTRREVVALLDRITGRGAPVAANRTLSLLSRLFRFAISRDIVRASPVIAIERNKEQPRDRILDEDEIRTLWTGLDSTPMSDAARRTLKFMLVSGARKGEVVTAERSDIKDGVWEIPASKSKNGKPHRVPLTDLAFGLLGDDDESPWFFPSPNKPGTAITAGSIDNALRSALPELGLEGITPHELRRTMAIGVAALKFPRFIVARLLNHVQRDVTGMHYDKYEYMDEKRAALEAWARRLQQIVSGEPGDGKVVELAAHRE